MTRKHIHGATLSALLFSTLLVATAAAQQVTPQRILRAEERANALPVKMMIPLGLCIFPVVLMIIMLPVIIRMKGIFF